MSKVKAPLWFNIIAVLAIIWNLMGVGAFVGLQMLTPEMLAEMPQDQQDLHNNNPIWNTVAFALAVFGGTIGSVLLLMKKKLARPILLLSLVGIIVQMAYNLTGGAMDVYGPGSLIMPTMVLLIGVLLVMLAGTGLKKSWLN